MRQIQWKTVIIKAIQIYSYVTMNTEKIYIFGVEVYAGFNFGNVLIFETVWNLWGTSHLLTN